MDGLKKVVADRYRTDTQISQFPCLGLRWGIVLPDRYPQAKEGKRRQQG